jgi:hypothetical protein
MKRAPASVSIPGSPSREHIRSPIAQQIARLAHESALFFAHFEHRTRLPVPLAWGGQEEDRSPSQWVGGTLPESKYQSFRHDLLIASFHPGHRAKWTAHELCHALVGFAYQPGSSGLFHTLGAWLAELLPVTVWYFFDEAGLRRCERHSGQGSLFQEHCEACERAALEGPRPRNRADTAFMREGQAFLRRELQAIGRSKRQGLPHGTRFATVDLASDALAYARAHGARLRAPEMERYVAQFFGPQQGHHATLESLEARLLEVEGALTKGSKVTPWRATRWDYAAQDLGYRLLSLRVERAEQAGRELDRLIDGLAADRTRRGLVRVMERYRELVESLPKGARQSRGASKGALGRTSENWPSPAELFAVGYELPSGHGSSRLQIEEGIASACPNTHAALGRQGATVVEAFAAEDRPERSPLGRRFARFMARTQPGPLADMASVEASITHVSPRDPISQTLPFGEGRPERVRLASGAEVLRLEHDVLGRSSAALRRAPRLRASRYLGVVRAGPEGVDLLELPPALAEKLAKIGLEPIDRQRLPVDDAALHELLAMGFLVPERYRL